MYCNWRVGCEVFPSYRWLEPRRPCLARVPFRFAAKCRHRKSRTLNLISIIRHVEAQQQIYIQKNRQSTGTLARARYSGWTRSTGAVKAAPWSMSSRNDFGRTETKREGQYNNRLSTGHTKHSNSALLRWTKSGNHTEVRRDEDEILMNQEKPSRTTCT